MRIFILTMDDPVQTNDFIKHIIENRRKDIVGLAVSKGNRLTIGKKRSKFVYILSLLLIMGIPSFVKNSIISIIFRFRKKLSMYRIGKNPGIIEFARSKGIPVYDINTPNNIKFLEILRELHPDIIINQSQNILKRELLSIPSIGVLNRHNALLPKNRGRLTPFWVLFKGETETGVSIHFVTEGIDAGDIIVQEKYAIHKDDTFNSLVRKNYKIAPGAILKAIELLENGYNEFIPNDDSLATYNTVPTLKNAIQYRKMKLKNTIGFHS